MAVALEPVVITQRIEVAQGLIIIRVTPDGWQLPDFEPGQFAVLALPWSARRHPDADAEEEPPKNPDKPIRRAYSIASSSRSRAYIEFYVAMVSAGALTPRIFALEIGDRLLMSTRISGMLTLNDVPEDQHLVLVATGTGLAPYMSMIRTSLEVESERRFAVIHGAYHSWDLGYRDELAMLDRLMPGFTYVPTLSHPHLEPTPWVGHTGFVQAVWTGGHLEREWGFKPAPEHTHVYLCGNPNMIEDMVELLTAEGFAEHSRRQPGNVHVERFW
jgi:ferredoxin--NADP+ reductase